MSKTFARDTQGGVAGSGGYVVYIAVRVVG